MKHYTPWHNWSIVRTTTRSQYATMLPNFTTGEPIRTCGDGCIPDYYRRISSPAEIAARLRYPNLTPAERAKYGL